MYSFNELDAMDQAQLNSIAESMGMKKASASSKEEVIYHILDNSASQLAKEEASKEQQRRLTKAGKERKRPGRKPKAVKEAEAKAAQEAQAQNADQPRADASAEEKPAPKKRGRKPKNKTPEAAAQDATTANSDETLQVSATTTPAPEEAPVKKRRGRPRKVRPEDETQKQETPMLPLFEANDTEAQASQPENTEANIPTTEENSGSEETPADDQPVKKIFTPRNGNNTAKPTLDAFFGNNKGRTFKPRGQQGEQPQQFNRHNRNNHEAAPEPQYPQGPSTVILQDPGANSQTPKSPMMLAGKTQNKRLQKQLQRQQRFHQAPVPFELDGILTCYGVLEIVPEGYGYLRSSDYNYLASPDDVYVNQHQIKQYGLKTGDVVEATIRPPRDGEKYYPLCQVKSVNGLEPAAVRDRVAFEHLTPLFPDEKFELAKGRRSNISTRVVDMFAPIGKGQRALIVAPPKTGKTILLKDIANVISENHPETYIMMLLIDERPEEVTDMARSVNAEVIASTFDEPAERHVKIANIVLEKAKRLVECGHDVVIMLDSITRLARAFNTVSPASGKILSGGVDANALQRPKRFFGAARNIEGGGSLTIIATALTETSSKMDEVIFEEFKGTGNMELQLDRKLSNKRIYPAVDIIASSTRRDDLLFGEEFINRMWILRNYLSDMTSTEAMEFIKKRMEMTRSNEELLVTMDK